MIKDKIGIGYITCNNELRFTQTAPLVPLFDELVIINDGNFYPPHLFPQKAHVIQHTLNMGVGKSKNEALRYLLDKGCEHIFLMEDDVIIKDATIFSLYIKAAKETGILHFNYALQGPHNRKQTINKLPLFQRAINKLLMRSKKEDASVRVKLDPLSEPDPRLEKKYPGGTSLRLYRNCAGALSYYHHNVLREVGLMDENFRNAWEHVHHTYKIIEAGYHPPFWWFADIAESETMLDNTLDCIAESTIAKSDRWLENIEWGNQYFKSIEGKKPGEIKDLGIKAVEKTLEQLKKRLNF